MHKTTKGVTIKINLNAPFSPRKARLDCRNKTDFSH